MKAAAIATAVVGGFIFGGLLHDRLHPRRPKSTRWYEPKSGERDP